MIKLNELKVGDIINAEYEGQLREGEVTDIDREEKLVCVETEVQDFWYGPEHLFPISVDDNQLKKFGFDRLDNPDGSSKYMRGAFRIMVPKKDDFSSFEIWYREDRRHIHHPITLHELQNHFQQMTKIYLTR
ncbi:MAG: hypothetical protein JST13_12125 [Bacteroidetes bacterium]|nr:hypothetical protein [Bacteroidota bacterium]